MEKWNKAKSRDKQNEQDKTKTENNIKDNMPQQQQQIEQEMRTKVKNEILCSRTTIISEVQRFVKYTFLPIMTQISQFSWVIKTPHVVLGIRRLFFWASCEYRRCDIIITKAYLLFRQRPSQNAFTILKNFPENAHVTMHCTKNALKKMKDQIVD